MNSFYRLICRTNEGNVKLGGEKCHETKSLAGRLFQSPTVKSVLVVDISGNVYLYLVKNAPEKTENVPSTEAVYG